MIKNSPSPLHEIAGGSGRIVEECNNNSEGGMKKLLMVFLAVVFMASFVYAEQTAAKTAEEITGVVDSINPVDPDRNNDEGGIIVRDGAGNASSYIINAETVVLDEFSNKIKSADIDDGANVNVSYSVSDSGKKALTIKRCAK